MALDRLSKLAVAVYRDECDVLLRDFQRAGIFHVIPLEEVDESNTDSPLLSRLRAAVDTLALSAGRKEKARPVLDRAEFEQALSSCDPTPVLDRIERIAKELADIDARDKQLDAERNRLEPWRELRYDPRDLYGLKGMLATLIRFADAAEFEKAQTAVAGVAAAIEETGRHGAEVMTVLLASIESAVDVSRVLSGIRYETVDLRDVRGRPDELLTEIAEKKAELEVRRNALMEERRSLSSELARLKLAADVIANDQKRKRVRAQGHYTDSVVFLRGWIRERDKGRFEEILKGVQTAAYETLSLEPEEEPPTALVNRPVFRPFELVLELFSMPSQKEMDPTWLVAPFFGVFFGLCLTDAGYGLVVALATWLVMRKLGTRNKLLGIVLLGALLTVPAGAMVGGWFGDLFDRLGINWLAAWKNRLVWFDPMKDPMKFFLLSVALGYTQLMAGILFEIADCLRNRDWGQGILGQLPWFVLLNGIVARVAAGRYLPDWANSGLVVAVLAAVAAIIVFTHREKKTAVAQTLWFGALFGLLLFAAAKHGFIPPSFVTARWIALLFFVMLEGQAATSLFRQGSIKVPTLTSAVVAISGLVAYLAGVLPWPIAALTGTIFFALSPAGSTLFSKLFWGGYALYGATSYVGVVLSYIRLMALGMCTGGVAMAINVIAWMLLKVPVVGILGALIVLVGGHAYNIAVNVLGAFVHSLRLQYVEFFPRFYTGGGQRFEPLTEEHQFVTVK